MPVIDSTLSPTSDAFQSNRAHMLGLLEQVRAHEQRTRDKSAAARERFEKRGQLLPRERIALLLDPGAPFLELSTLAGLGLDTPDLAKSVPGGGVIAGIGFVSGIRCMVMASDSGIDAGALQPMGLDKILRGQELALENKLPYVQLVESAGANLLEYRVEDFIRGGSTFRNLARLSAAGLPVVTVTHGSSTAGGAYQTGLSDYIVLVRDRSRAFLAGPPLLKAATGEIATEEELGGAVMHTHVSGLGDYLAEDDRDALRIARDILARIGWDRHGTHERRAFEPPLYDAEELLGVIPADLKRPVDMRQVIARIADGSDFLEFGANYGSATLCGHFAIEGWPVGVITNNGPIDSAGANKATHFIQACCQSRTPLLYRGASFGAGNYGMCGRGFAPRFCFSWPNARTAVMGGEQAAGTMRMVTEAAMKRKGAVDEKKLDELERRIVERFDSQMSVFTTSARLLDDGVIDPRQTRDVLAEVFATCREAQERQPMKMQFSVARP
jgi:geranyl-CoA carboxylase beta subunit